MVKIKLIARENTNDGRINVSLEPFISRGTTKEQQAGAYLLVKVSEMLSDLEKSLNEMQANQYYGSELEKEDAKEWINGLDKDLINL